MSDPLELAQSWLDRHALSCARGHAHQHDVCEISQTLLDRDRQLRELREAVERIGEHASSCWAGTATYEDFGDIATAAENALKGEWDSFTAALAASAPDAKNENCDGGSACKAERHIHGCFADRGNCDHPDEHHAASDPDVKDETA